MRSVFWCIPLLLLPLGALGLFTAGKTAPEEALLKFHVTDEGVQAAAFESPRLKFKKIVLNEFPDRPRLLNTLKALTLQLAASPGEATYVEASVLVDGKSVLHASQATGQRRGPKIETIFYRDKFAPSLVLSEAERKQVYWRFTLLLARETLKSQAGQQANGTDSIMLEMGISSSAVADISREAGDKKWPDATLSGPMKAHAKEWEYPTSPTAMAIKNLNAKPKMLFLNPAEHEALYRMSKLSGSTPSKIAKKLEVTVQAVQQLNRIAQENRWDRA
jgi:hypothetical protein